MFVMFCIYVYVGIVFYCFLFLSCPQCFFFLLCYILFFGLYYQVKSPLFI